MSKCIQPSCSCNGYKEPLSKRSTLVLFRQSCQECGHYASDHRELTAVDKYIKAQVSSGKRKKCTSLISPSEIPMSPVFDRYDLISIPYREPTSNKGDGVQCTCSGFRIPDLIRLCQKFRTYSLSDAAPKLSAIACSFCKHPFSAHVTANKDETKDVSFSTKKPALGMYHGLIKMESSFVNFSPANQKSLELILPSNPDEKFLMVAVGKFKPSEMFSLVFVGHCLNPAELTNASASADGGTIIIEPHGVDGGGGGGGGGGGAPKEELDLSSVKRVKRKQLSNPAFRRDARRSARLAVKKSRLEGLEELKGLKGSERMLEIEDTDMNQETELTELECKQLIDHSISFVKHLYIHDSYQSFLLPPELLNLSVNTSPIMTSLRINESMNRDSVLVAVSSKNSSATFLLAISCNASSTDETPVSQEWHKVACQEQGRMECLSLKEESNRSLVSEVLLMVGMSTGTVCIWRVTLDQGRIKDSVLVTSIHCGSQVFVLSCSPDARILAAGTIFGAVALCFLASSDGASLPVGSSQPPLQTVQCCNASVKCIAWSEDKRLVAVGGCDDAIQVLQCVEPKKSNPAANSSLLKYFKVSEQPPKFIHTCTLKGHASFITDLKFTHEHCLASIGWDSKIFFWKNLTQSKLTEPSTKNNRGGGGRPIDLEPVGGFKLGPSNVPDFLPSSIHFPMGCGLMVSMANKLGGATVAYYSKKNHSSISI